MTSQIRPDPRYRGSEVTIMTTTSAQGPWHKTTADLIAAAEAGIRSLGFQPDGEATERWEGDGVMLVCPMWTAPADDRHHWYLSLAGTDNGYYGEEPSIDVIVIGPKTEKYDRHEALRDWDHLKEILAAEGYLSP